MSITIIKQCCITVCFQPLGEGGALFSSVGSLKQSNNELSHVLGAFYYWKYIIGYTIQVLCSHK
jgi:hypothetical protein